MDGITFAAIGRFAGEAGIYGLGWILFLYMMVREIRERKRYSDLVIHIISYFTKVNMVERHTDDAPLIPSELFGLPRPTRKGQRRPRRGSGAVDHEE